MDFVKYNCFSTSYRAFLMFFANIMYKPVERIEFNINNDILFRANKWQKRKDFRRMTKCQPNETGNYTTYPN